MGLRMGCGGSGGGGEATHVLGMAQQALLPPQTALVGELACEEDEHHQEAKHQHDEAFQVWEGCVHQKGAHDGGRGRGTSEGVAGADLD